jgi:hypothetical protein
MYYLENVAQGAFIDGGSVKFLQRVVEAAVVVAR